MSAVSLLVPKAKSSPVKSDDIQTGRDVLRLEARALDALADTSGWQLCQSRGLHPVQASRAVLIVTGMGKSGHVARKIAATLASTGTPGHLSCIRVKPAMAIWA
jgi:D-arabinose 5-phosphate isomerase GutQ